jgi:uncharacterized SAM-binding protein YcdF (DUF218 family)
MLHSRRRLFVYFIALVFISFSGASLAIVEAGLHDNLHAADLAVVLGSKVDRDGHPSLELQARLDRAIALYRQGYFKLVLVSGGRGREGYDEPVVMAQYLEAHGVPASAILEDNDGNTTWMTAKNTARVMDERHLKSALVVSEYYHMPRCRLAFEKFGIAPVYTSHAQFWCLRNFFSVPREVIGYAAYSMRRPDAIDSASAVD